MTERREAGEFLKLAPEFQVVDVRSPGEFRQGHIPGAINIPLFSDKERARIGTLYHREGRETAILQGLMISLDHMERYRRQMFDRMAGPKVLVYCWRGGMRSENMAEMFRAAGFSVILLKEGYKAYRRYIREELSKSMKIFVLGGLTGSGKSMLLRRMAQMGQQVIDLEKLAVHKGSVFGGLGNRPQPTNEQFENNLYRIWSALDPARPVWLEDESRMIGKVTLPPPVIEKIRSGLLIRIGIPEEIRIRNLVKEYSGFPKERLADAIQRISERLGGDRTQYALAALESGNFSDVARIVLSYYDKTYQHSVLNRERVTPFIAGLDGLDPRRNAGELIALLRQSKIPDHYDLS